MADLRSSGHLMADPRLHLSTSMRSFRSEKVSAFVKAVLDCDEQGARATAQRGEKVGEDKIDREAGHAFPIARQMIARNASKQSPSMAVPTSAAMIAIASASGIAAALRSELAGVRR